MLVDATIRIRSGRLILQTGVGGDKLAETHQVSSALGAKSANQVSSREDR